MFSLNPKPVFWVPVRLTVPGEPEPATLELQFAHMATDQLKSWVDDAKERATNDADTIRTIVRDWRGVDAEFSEAALAQLVRNYPASAAEIFEQYLRALTESRTKN
jgi:hypothetical protein